MLSFLYGKVMDLRNALYDRGVFETYDLGARTISIGNITTGGTGKTPLVAYVAEILAAGGDIVCILTRGYGRENAKTRVLVSDGVEVVDDPQRTGDEPLELAQKLLGKAIVIADADRVAAAEWARRKFGVTVFVLDDGFQHRKAKRDVDIVCIDATDPFGGGKMLPAGRLREPLHNLSRASSIVITRADLVDADTLSSLRSDISEWNMNPLVFEASNTIADLRPLGSNAETLKNQKGEKIFAFCGLGNPENFFLSLRRDGFDVVGTTTFPDHAFYTQTDIDRVQNDARNAGATAMLTTAKDAVKLSNLKFETPCFVVETELRVDDAARFAALAFLGRRGLFVTPVIRPDDEDVDQNTDKQQYKKEDY